jgi:hypothetical protein
VIAVTQPVKIWFEAEGRLLQLRLSRPKANLVDAAMIAAELNLTAPRSHRFG